jgi:hypothetical protein
VGGVRRRGEGEDEQGVGELGEDVEVFLWAGSAGETGAKESRERKARG